MFVAKTCSLVSNGLWEWVWVLTKDAASLSRFGSSPRQEPLRLWASALVFDRTLTHHFTSKSVSHKRVLSLWLFWCNGKIAVKLLSSLRSQVSKEADKVAGERFLVFWCNHWNGGNAKEVTYQGHLCFKWSLGMEVCPGLIFVQLYRSVAWSWLTYFIWHATFFFSLFCITSLVDGILVLLLWSLLSLTVFSITT